MVEIRAKIVKISGKNVSLYVYPEGEPHHYEITLPVEEPALIDLVAARIGTQRYRIEIKNGQIASIAE